MADQQYWILVSSADNLEATRAHGFTVQGMKSRHRKKAEQMKPGDKLVYYLTGRKTFAATAIVTSDCFEGHEPIWTSKNTKANGEPEDYPWRVRVEPEVIADADDWIDAEPVARQMTHTKKWPAEHWTLAFQGNVHSVPEEDYELIHRLLKEAVGGEAAQATT